MLKKSLIFGSVALFLAALITLTGCPTSTDDSSSTISYGHRIFGDRVDPYQAQAAIDDAVKAGEAVVLEHNLIIQNGGALNFKTATVRINGTVTLNEGVMNMADATVSWAPGAVLIMNGGFYIHKWDPDFDFAAKVIGVNIDPTEVWFVESVETIQSTAIFAAVRNFTLGDKQNFDYSRNSSGVNARISAAALQGLFVVGKLTIPPESTVPSADFVIGGLGEVDVTGTVRSAGVIVGGPLDGTVPLPLGSCSVLTSSGNANIWVPDPPAVPDGKTIIPNIRVEAGRAITLGQENGPAPLEIRGKLTGPGTLTVSATDITINGGDGNVNVATAGNRQLQIYSTGKVTFEDALTIRRGSEIYSTAVFRGNLTVNGPLGLYGDVIVGNNRNIIFSSPVTLGAGKTITLEITPQGSVQTIPAALLTAPDGDVVLTPGVGGATLSTPANPRDASPERLAEVKRITLVAGVPIEITDGTLQVVPEATFVVSANITTGIDGVGREFGYLSAAEGGGLTLNGGDLEIGDGSMTVNTPFNFIAAGGTVTLGNYTIAGSAAGTKLSPARGSSGVIDVASALTLDQLELNLSEFSSIGIGATDQVILDRGAKIILTAGENGQPVTDRRTLTAGNNTARLTGGFVGLSSDPTAVPGAPALSIAHQPGEPAVNITAVTNITLGRSSRPTFTR